MQLKQWAVLLSWAGCVGGTACAGGGREVISGGGRTPEGPLRTASRPPSPPPDAESLFLPIGEKEVPGREWSSYDDCYSAYASKYGFNLIQSQEDTGRRLLVEINTGRSAEEAVGGVLAEEGPVELIPLESIRAIGVRQPPQSEGKLRLRGVAKLGRVKGPSGGLRLFVHVDKLGLGSGRGWYLPMCAMLTQGEQWGLPVFTDTTTGQLYVLPTAHAELVQAFDESTPPRAKAPARE